MGKEQEWCRRIPFLLPHLLKRIRKIKRTNLLCILELQKLIPAMARHVHQYITPIIRQQPLAARHVLAHAVRHEADEVLHRDFVAPVIDFDVVAVKIERAVRVVEYGCWEGVARVARHVVG
jgi:hypothetical protein